MAKFHTKGGIADVDSSFWEIVWENDFEVSVIKIQTSEPACSIYVIYTFDRKKPVW